MLVGYILQQDSLRQIPEQELSEYADRLIWVDLLNPS